MAAVDKNEKESTHEEVFLQYGPGQIMNKDNSGSGKWIFVGWIGDTNWRTGFCAQKCPGHDSPEEAEQHQKEWISLFETTYWVQNYRKQPCVVCDKPTDQCIRLDWVLGQYRSVCDEHMSPKIAESLIGSLLGTVR